MAIHGDSKLIVDFLVGAASPNKRTLLAAMRKARKCVESLPAGVQVVHIPRAQNSTCDWLAGKAI